MFGFFFVFLLVGIVAYYGFKYTQQYLQKQIGGELTPTTKFIVLLAIYGAIQFVFFLFKILLSLVLLIL